MAITSQQVKDILVQNFADIRITSITLFLEKLIERKSFSEGIEQYRITDSVTNSKVTSLTDFIAKLDPGTLNTDYFYDIAVQGNGHVHPLAVVPTNFKVELTEHSEEDVLFTRRYGKVSRICFIVNYLSDGDTELPMKILDVRLY